jgi:soluble cytochrome b562
VEQGSAQAPFVIRWREGFKIAIARIDDALEHRASVDAALASMARRFGIRD